MTDDLPSVPAALRTRLAADIAAGKTVSLSPTELADPELRAQLPALLDQLTGHGPAPAGVRVPGFTLLTEIGHGGMSTVYLARQDALHRHVALKVAPKWLAGDKRMQQRLLQEARAMARVSHPNVVAIHDILEVDDTVAISMDWIDGLSLTEVLRVLGTNARDDDLDRVREALGNPDPTSFPANITTWFVMVVRDIARAVHHVHEAGLLHLDIKPSNVLVRRDGTPLLADFGVVREIDLASTHTHSFAGTPIYAAPEQLQRQDRAFGAHTDVYGLGMTLYELLTRTQPLRGLDLTRVLQNVLSGRIAPIATRVPIAPDLATIVHKAIAPERDHRYADAAQLADDLTAFLEHRPVSARPLTRMQHVRRWARLEPWKALFAAVLLVTVPCLLGLGAYLVLQYPHIVQAQTAERLALANDLKQRAYLTYFVTQAVAGRASQDLQAAMAQDPGVTSLACLLAMTHEEGLQDTDRLLVAHRSDVDRSRGLSMFATKVAERRPFFTPAEVTTLRASTDPDDKYVLALDRVFFAEDARHEEAYRDAELALDEAALTAGSDPLLFGLRLWTAGLADDPDRHRGIVRAMLGRWPDDPRMLAWRYYSLELIDEPAAREFAQQLTQRHPAQPVGWEMLAGGALRRGAYEEALGHAQAAAVANASSDELRMYELLAHARSDKQTAALALRDMPKHLLTIRRELELSHAIDPAAATSRRAELLAAPDAARPALASLFRESMRVGNEAQTELAWQRLRELYPHRRALHETRINMLAQRRDYRAAAELFAEWTTARRVPHARWRQLASLLVSARAWPALAPFAERWERFAKPEDRAESAFHVALARSRAGDVAGAAAPLAMAVAARDVQLQWYGSALLEDAWLHVRTDAPANRRDPAIAARRIAQFDAWPPVKSFPVGPWALLVKAEVQFANGDRDGAIATARRAQRVRHVVLGVPDDCTELLAAAIARYGR